MRTWALPLFFLLGVSSLPAQENCANGIDDDADGLIDLNDVEDCSCALSSTLTSLLPNPSLEEFAADTDGCYSLQPGGYPDAVNQANCLVGWERASLGTTDAWNAFTLPAAGPYFPATLPQPLPSGSGVAGFWVGIQDEGEHQFYNGNGTTTTQYREYLAACLVDGEKMEEGLPYRLQFSLGFIEPQQAIEVDIIDIRSPGPVELSIYGIRECSQLNFGDFYGCPEEAGAAGYELIANVTVDGNAGKWSAVKLDFTAPGTYSAFAIGGSCAADHTRPDGGFYRNYYFIDNLILNHPEAFATPVAGPVQVSGLTVCEPITLTATQQTGATYQWYRNGVAMVGKTAATLVLAPDFSIDGDYRVKISIPAGCAVSEAVHIQRPVIIDQFPETVAICQLGDTTTVSAKRRGGATFRWQDGSTDSKLLVSEPGTYSVTITEACQEHTEQFEVMIDPPFRYTVSFTPEFPCPGDSVTVRVQTNSYRPRIFFRSLPEETMLPAQNGSVKVIAGKTDAILAFIGNQCGLEMDTIFIPVASPLPTAVTQVTDIDCSGEMGQIAITGLPESVNYQWYDGMGNEIGTNTATPAIAVAGDYSVLLTDNGHCEGSLHFTVKQLSSITANISTTKANCTTGGSITISDLNGTAPFTINWSRRGEALASLVNSRQLTDLPSGSYDVEIEDASGCSFQQRVVIDDQPSVTATTSSGTGDCFATNTGNLTVAASGGTAPYTYQLSGGRKQSSPYFQNLPQGSYSVTVSDAVGCSFTTESVSITDPLPTTFDLGPTRTLHPGETLLLNQSAEGKTKVGTVSWAPANGLSCTDCIAPAAAPTRTTEYTMTYTTETGCVSTTKLLVIVSDDALVYVPNAFSPDGDGTNDTFQAFTGTGVVAVTELVVYGRWGELIYQQVSSEDGGWDGTFRGRAMPTGVYVYSGEVLLTNGESRPIDGSVTLVR